MKGNLEYKLRTFGIVILNIMERLQIPQKTFVQKILHTQKKFTYTKFPL